MENYPSQNRRVYKERDHEIIRLRIENQTKTKQAKPQNEHKLFYSAGL